MSGEDERIQAPGEEETSARAPHIPRELAPFVEKLPNPVIRPGDDPVLDAAVAGLRELNGSDDPFYVDRRGAGDPGRGVGNVRVYVGPTKPGSPPGAGASRSSARRVTAFLAAGGALAVALWMAVRLASTGDEVRGESSVGGPSPAAVTVMTASLVAPVQRPEEAPSARPPVSASVSASAPAPVSAPVSAPAPATASATAAPPAPSARPPARPPAPAPTIPPEFLE